MERRAGGSERIRGTYVYGTAARQLNTALPKTDYDEQRAKRRREQDAELVVCGLPKSMNNQQNAQTAKTREFAEKLKSYISVPVKFFDERLTTVSAERALIEGGVRREDRKNVIDKVAATMILQNYLAYIN